MDKVRCDQRVVEPYKACEAEELAEELAEEHLAAELEHLELLELDDDRQVKTVPERGLPAYG